MPPVAAPRIALVIGACLLLLLLGCFPLQLNNGGTTTSEGLPAEIAAQAYDQWFFASETAKDIGARELAIHPARPGRIWAATSGAGVLISDDDGANWSSKALETPALKYATLRDIAFHPTNPDTVYVVTALNVLKTTNGGQSWAILGAGTLPSTWGYYSRLQVSPSNPDIVYFAPNVAPSPAAVFKSTDAGASWSLAANGITTGDTNAIAIHPTNPDIVFVGSGSSAFGSNAVWRTTDGGLNWTNANGNLVNARYTLAEFTPSGNRLFVAGYGNSSGRLCYTDDLAATNWVCPNTPAFGVGQVTDRLAFRSDTDFLVVMTDNSTYELYNTTDGGSTYSHKSRINRAAYDVIIHPSNPNRIYVGALKLLQRSTDGGATRAALSRIRSTPRRPTSSPIRPA